MLLPNQSIAGMVIVEGGKRPLFALNTAQDRPIKWIITKVVLTASLGLVRGQERGGTIEYSLKLRELQTYAKTNHWRRHLPDLPLCLRRAKNGL